MAYLSPIADRHQLAPVNVQHQLPHQLAGAITNIVHASRSHQWQASTVTNHIGRHQEVTCG